MCTVGDIPASVSQEVATISALDAQAPPKATDNVLIATWNVRSFGGLTTKWSATQADTPKRDWRAVALIAEVASRFDVIAIQEVRRNTTALRFLFQQLGSGWRVIASDVTASGAGNDERLAFLYDAQRVEPSGLVGEIVCRASSTNPPSNSPEHRTSRAQHFYDQIAWFSTPAGASLLNSVIYTSRTGHFDFVPHVYPTATRKEVSWRISDHYPLWVEFRIKVCLTGTDGATGSSHLGVCSKRPHRKLGHQLVGADKSNPRCPLREQTVPKCHDLALGTLWPNSRRRRYEAMGSAEWLVARDALVGGVAAAPTALLGVYEPGLYAWWDRQGALAAHYPSAFPHVDASLPLYVGVARTTLSGRAGEMHLDKTRVSTVRRSLLALLHGPLDLTEGVTARRKKKYSLDPALEQRLTDWMLENLTVTWHVRIRPDLVERAVVGDLTPLFNDTFAHAGPYWRAMRDLRYELHGIAAAREASANEEGMTS